MSYFLRMSAGFVYILLNPAFPDHLKVGCTTRETARRARELSRYSGVPRDFIVIYDEFVSDAQRVEAILHERLDSYRVHRSKEFFAMRPKEDVRILQELASSFPITAETPRLDVDLLPHLVEDFRAYLDPSIVSVRFAQLPGEHVLEVERIVDGAIMKTFESLPLEGLEAPENPTQSAVDSNIARLRACSAFDWDMIANIFSPGWSAQISKEWSKKKS